MIDDVRDRYDRGLNQRRRDHGAGYPVLIRIEGLE